MQVALAAVCVALALTASAAAWEQTYAANTTFNPGGIALSGFNYGLNWNRIVFTPFLSTDWGRLTLCDSSYQCYDYVGLQGGGTLTDLRSISYGRGKCNAPSFNTSQIYIDYCRVRN